MESRKLTKSKKELLQSIPVPGITGCIYGSSGRDVAETEVISEEDFTKAREVWEAWEADGFKNIPPRYKKKRKICGLECCESVYWVIKAIVYTMCFVVSLKWNLLLWKAMVDFLTK